MGEDKIAERTKTIFIKRNNQTQKVEKAWSGFVDNIELDDSDVISFNVNIEKEIPIQPKYSNYVNGWYFEESEELGEGEEKVVDKMSIYPPFFDILKKTTSWQDFEKLAFQLLKLLGIHDIYPYASNEQSGKADGFFIFKRLAVLYDCTLECDFMERKKQQIENYVASLNTGRIEYRGRVRTFSQYNKQVWIITRGSSRMINFVDDVLIREIPIDKIVQIYQNRLDNNIDEIELENQLKDI